LEPTVAHITIYLAAHFIHLGLEVRYERIE
jgi:hypothetical protein